MIMAEDLSHLVPGLVPTSQSAGNATSSNEKAMTAPGSLPVDPLPDRAHQSDPAMDETHGDWTRRDRGDGEHTRPAPTWTRTS